MYASEVRLVILDGSKAQFQHVDRAPRKLSLADDENRDEIRAFQDSLYAFFRENRVEYVAVKKRNKKGEYAGGPVGFKMEAVAQLFGGCAVDLLTPQAIAAAIRSNQPDQPTTLRGYQKHAFETAYCALP
jgi:hypothetical protein